jgi:hypothetical protein
MDATSKEPEIILEPYLTRIDKLRSQMRFHTFENGKHYAFDYSFKEQFAQIVRQIDELSRKEEEVMVSPAVTNKLPIFLPEQTRRIAFFEYTSKSVRKVEIDKLEKMLTNQAFKKFRNGEIKESEISRLVREDMNTFEAYQKEHGFKAYRRDIATTTVQFNAYDSSDNLLIEKSFVRGGLVFNLPPMEFSNKINISYPRYRKQRSDKKNDYLPLKLLKIRGIELSQKESL